MNQKTFNFTACKSNKTWWMPDDCCKNPSLHDDARKHEHNDDHARDDVHEHNGGGNDNTNINNIIINTSNMSTTSTSKRAGGSGGSGGTTGGTGINRNINSAIILLLFVICLGTTRAADNPGSQSWELGPFVRPQPSQPVISPDTNLVFECPMNRRPIPWAALHTFNPAAIVRDGQVCVLYRSEDATGVMHVGGHTSRIGLAKSQDGLRFASQPAPVLFPADDNQKTNEWTGGCEDPRIVETEDRRYVMTYTEYCRGDSRRLAQLGVATSTDLIHWIKHGPVFDKFGGDFAHHPCKSGAILTQLVKGKLLAVKLLGQYRMYWGEGAIRLASSDDLVNWHPGPVVLKTRAGKFDSALVEAGPPAILTRNGIVVIYNGKNDGKTGDITLKAGVYSGGQALFDSADPEKLLARTDAPFFKPEYPFEITGQYGAGTTFLEGLVAFHGQWFLYYGCADSYVAVATAPISGVL